MESEIKEKPRIGVARQLARKLLKEVGIDDLPVSLQKIGEYLNRERGLQLQGVGDFEKLSGMTVMVDSTPTIAFNTNHGWYKRRFTIAHEIGHVLMNTTHNDLGAALDTSNPIEVEANEFAAELLMPLQQFKSDCRSGINSLDVLSEKYKVSKEAAGWRLVHSGALAKL